MGLKDALIQKLWGILQGLIDKYSSFIQKPSALKAVYAAASGIINGLLDQLKPLLQSKIEQALANGLDRLAGSLFQPGDLFGDNFDELARKYVARHPGLVAVNSYIDRDLEESHLGNITLACSDPDYDDDRLREMAGRLQGPAEVSGKEYLDKINADSDFDDGINNLLSRAAIADLLNKVNDALPWVFMVYVILLQLKEWMSQNEYPSKYRGKYLSKKIRLVGALLKKAALDTSTDLKQTAITARDRSADRIDDIKEQAKSEIEAAKQVPGDVIETGRDLINSSSDLINGLIGSLKKLDSLIGGVLLAGLIYELNRRFLQERALEELNATTQSVLCPPEEIPASSFEDQDLSAVSDEDINRFSCPIPLDNVIVPHEPIESKQEAFSCPIDVDSFAQTTLGVPPAPQPSLATKALYTNLGASTIALLPNTGDIIEPGTPLMSGRDSDNSPFIIYSEISGVVKSIDRSTQEIEVHNISTPEQTPLEKAIEELNALYKKQSDTDIFIKDWYIRTILPTMLYYSPLIDGSISSTEYSNIVYFTGGITKREEKVHKDRERLDESFNKEAENKMSSDSIKSSLGGGNIDPNSENTSPGEDKTNPGGLTKIKDTLDKMMEKYYKDLRKIGDRANSEAALTLPKDDEFIMWEWYAILYDELLAASTDQSDSFTKINREEEQANSENTYLPSFTAKVNEFLIQRAFTDGTSANTELLIEKINDLGKTLEEYGGTSLSSGVDPSGNNWTYYSTMEQMFLEATKDVEVTTLSAQDYRKTISSWVSGLGKKNTKLSSEEKSSYQTRLYRTWELLKTLSILALQEYETEETPFTLAQKEGTYFDSFFKELYKNRLELPELINEKIQFIDEIRRSSLVPVTIYRDNEEYLMYALGDDRSCPIPETPDPRLSPFSEYEFKDIQYWLKYCAWATLASIASLPPNWGTGFPPPFNIPFPTVYIPIKAFQLAWGVLVIGITLTGIYPFPWVMVGNLSTDAHVPFIDPATIIQKSIDKVKETLIGKLRDFRGTMLQSAMDDVKVEIDSAETKLSELDSTITTHRENKPKRDREQEAFGNKVQAIAAHTEALANWEQQGLTLQEEKVSTKSELFVAQTKWDILYQAQSGSGDLKGNNDPRVVALEKTEAGIERTFDELQRLVDSIEPFVSALPVSTQGGSANFLFTLKNPRPVTEMADGLNETINNPLLSKIQKPFDLNRDDLMSSNYSTKVNLSFINGKRYMNTLAASMVALIPKDPFPKYEMLVPWNLAWTLKFLLPSWAPTGGGQYGFPGFPKVPIG